MLAIKNNKIILRGKRNPNDKLWDIPIKKKEITNYNYTMPPIHLAIYQKINVCVHNNWNQERGKGEIKPALNNKFKEKEKITNSFLNDLKQFKEIIDHNILDIFLEKNTAITNTIDTKYKNIDMNPIIKPMHPHLNDKPWQKKSV